MKYFFLVAVACFSALAFFAFAYTKAIATEARDRPLLPLAGTDTRKLQIAIAELERAVDAVAQEQTPEDARTMTHLYPIAFLNAVAEAEDARQQVRASPSVRTAFAYEKSVREALSKGAEAAVLFSDELGSLSTSSHPTLYSLSGAVTYDSLRAGAAQLRERFETLQNEQSRRAWCRFVCPTPAGTPPDESDTTPHASTQELEMFFHQTATNGTTPRSTTVSLSDSACTRELAGPQHFLVFDYEDARPSIHHLNELFALPLAGYSGPVAQLLVAEGITHSIVRPTMFYTCPEMQHDAGALFAIDAIVQFASTSPLAPEERSALLLNPNAMRARNYIEAALQDPAAPAPILNELRLALDARSARLEVLVSKIAEVLSYRTSQYRRGVPFDFSAYNLYLTHSAFPSLYLAHDSSVVSFPVSITTRSPEAAELFAETHLRFSELSARTRATLAEDAIMLWKFDSTP